VTRLPHITFRPLAGVLLAVLSAAALGVACSDSGGSGRDTAKTGVTTTAPGPSTAQVVLVQAPASVDCNGHTSTMIPVTYKTTGASKQVLLIDGRPVPISAPEATVQAQVHCDELPHTVAVVAYDAKGRRVGKDTMVTTNL
jgi:hypothetical protein